VDSLGIRLVGNEWVREWTLLRTTQRKRGPLVIWTDTSNETSAGTLQTRKKPLNNLVVMSYWTAQKCVRVLTRTMGIRLSRMIVTHEECVQPLQSVKKLL
jgi:hypothetical protein